MTSVGLPLLRTSPDAAIPHFPFLSIAGPSRDRRCLQFAFASPLAPCLVEPARWAPVDLAVLRELPSGAAVVLYEHLIQRAGQRRPVWRVRVDELRAFLGAAPERSWRDLRRHIVAPAIARIESAAGLRIGNRAASCGEHTGRSAIRDLRQINATMEFPDGVLLRGEVAT